MSDAAKILIVEDEGIVALDLKVHLSGLGYTIIGPVARGDEAVERSAAKRPDLILMDIHLRGKLNGIDAAQTIRKRQDVPIVFLTAHSDTATLAGAKAVTPYGYLVKPYEERTLRSTIEMALYKHQMEQKLKQEEENFRRLTESASDGIVISDAQGNIIYVNNRGAEISGYTRQELLERRMEDLVGNALACECLNIDRVPNRCETNIRRKTGVRIPVEVSSLRTHWRGEPVPMLMVRDISALKAAEEERERLRNKLAQAEKLKAIGTLAGGVAHDFNNLLMGIQGRASLMAVEMGPEHSQQEHLAAIEAYVGSATKLTKQLLGFARGGQYEVRTIDVNQLVIDSAEMFGRTRKEIRMHIKTHGTSMAVEADRGQIEQVLLNMYLNAWQAMPGGGGLFLETSPVTLDADECRPHHVAAGSFVKISVTDTGIGMDENTRWRIFDPFFTTKEIGRGTGLGLSSAYGIISNHGGMITVYSEIDCGTTFNIYLPHSDREIFQEAPPVNDLDSGSGTVLLVDDEQLIVDVGQAMLEKLGYRVIVAGNGEQAVDVISAVGYPIDLVILDMIMPGMDGHETFDRLRALKPAQPIILSSGYALNGKVAAIMKKGCNGFIQKPFNIAELSQKVRQVLETAEKPPETESPRDVR